MKNVIVLLLFTTVIIQQITFGQHDNCENYEVEVREYRNYGGLTDTSNINFIEFGNEDNYIKEQAYLIYFEKYKSNKIMSRIDAESHKRIGDKEFYEYDNDRLIKIVSGGLIPMYKKYSYDDNGRLNKIEKFDQAYGRDIKSYIKQYSYLEDTTLMEHISIPGNPDWIFWEKTIYANDNTKLLKLDRFGKETRYEFGDIISESYVDGTMYRYFNTYNECKNLIKTICIDNENIVGQIITKKYNYKPD